MDEKSGARDQNMPFSQMLLLATVGIEALLFSEEQQAASDKSKANKTDARKQCPSDRKGVDGKGVDADAPVEIPAAGWKDILLRVYANFARHRVLALAAAMTFYSLLALFPALAAFVSLYSLVADPGAIQSQLKALGPILPGGAIEIIGDQIKSLSASSGGSLGFGSALGIAVALWSANSGVKAVFDAINVVDDQEEQRGFLKLNAITLAVTTGAILLLIVALAAIVGIPALLAFAHLNETTNWLLYIARWPALLALVALAISVLYRIAPGHDRPKWKWVTPGSAFASIAWLATSMLFSWYVACFGNYNKTYGALGAAIGFMTWIWLSGIIVLLGAEINTQAKSQTTRSTTQE